MSLTGLTDQTRVCKVQATTSITKPPSGRLSHVGPSGSPTGWVSTVRSVTVLNRYHPTDKESHCGSFSFGV